MSFLSTGTSLLFPSFEELYIVSSLTSSVFSISLSVSTFSLFLSLWLILSLSELRFSIFSEFSSLFILVPSPKFSVFVSILSSLKPILVLILSSSISVLVSVSEWIDDPISILFFPISVLSVSGKTFSSLPSLFSKYLLELVSVTLLSPKFRISSVSPFLAVLILIKVSLWSFIIEFFALFKMPSAYVLSSISEIIPDSVLSLIYKFSSVFSLFPKILLSDWILSSFSVLFSIGDLSAEIELSIISVLIPPSWSKLSPISVWPIGSIFSPVSIFLPDSILSLGRIFPDDSVFPCSIFSPGPPFLPGFPVALFSIFPPDGSLLSLEGLPPPPEGISFPPEFQL